MSDQNPKSVSSSCHNTADGFYLYSTNEKKEEDNDSSSIIHIPDDDSLLGNEFIDLFDEENNGGRRVDVGTDYADCTSSTSRSSAAKVSSFPSPISSSSSSSSGVDNCATTSQTNSFLELTWPIWHMLPRDERKAIVLSHGLKSIGEFEEYMTLNKAINVSEDASEKVSGRESKPYKIAVLYQEESNPKYYGTGTVSSNKEEEIALTTTTISTSPTTTHGEIYASSTMSSSTTQKGEMDLFETIPSFQSLDTTDADARLATQLQAEGDMAGVKWGADIAARLEVGKNARFETIPSFQSIDTTDADARLAAQLQAEEDMSGVKWDANSTAQLDSMKSSIAGQAWLFTEQVLRLHTQFLMQHKKNDEIAPVALDDMVYTCEKLLQCQETFRKLDLPTNVTIAYHYTCQQSMDTIQQHGLLSKNERNDMMIRENRTHGAAFGNGIYTANNPLAFKSFGEVGLLVATLRGKIQTVSGRNGSGDANTVIGNKRRGFHGGGISYYDEIVLRQSSQCLALIQYKSHLAHDDLIWTYHVKLQKLVDNFFNGEVPTELERVHPPEGMVSGGYHSFGAPILLKTGLFASSSVNNANGMTPIIGGATVASGTAPMQQQPQQVKHQTQQQVQYQHQQQRTQAQPAQPRLPQQPQQAQQRHIANRGLNRGWQSDRDVEERRRMIAKIVLLRQRQMPQHHHPDDGNRSYPPHHPHHHYGGD
mmetsp:Transcript_7565/g.10463  ORF Transcript_7565/g.10463 Transcript_7565/m.10463 type:complete len:707 (-) Transcript_7565:856-2976(-)